ncbi:hypothetical protein GCM10028819_44610 [Spirosoma humi]
MSAHKQISYLGSEYFSFPAWQEGTIQLDQAGKEIKCVLAYNLVDNKIMCQFDKDVAATAVKPYAFTMNGIRFVKQPTKVLGIDYQSYATVINGHQTKLLKSLTRRLVAKSVRNGYEKSGLFDGYYQTQERYYIRKGDAQPQLTTLSKSSLADILYEHSEEIIARFPQKKFTSDEVANVLAYYDSLTAIADVDKPSLSRDAAFRAFLHNELKYPNRAWNQGVYGRVYAGFDVNQDGHLTNVSLLSPDNIGFDFDKTVKQVLLNLASVKPAFAGSYILPVAFTYTNTKDEEPAHVPINTLAPERFDGRTVLQEIVVPVVVSKPVIESREVWGYYKQ